MKKKAFIYIILAGLLWGTSGIFVQLLAPFGFTSLHMTAMRGVVSVILMCSYMLLHDKKLFAVTGKELILYALNGIFIFSTASLYYTSMQASSVSTAVVLMYTAPVFVLIYSVAFLGEKMSPLKTVAIALMIIGCALVSGIIGGIRFSVWGITAGFLSGIAYSLYNITAKIEMRRKYNPVTATTYTFIFMMIAALCLCDLPSLLGVISENSKSLAMWPLIIGIGICTSVLPYFLYTLAMKYLPAGVASALGIVEPMAATVYSVLLFKEELGILPFCGIVLILGAVFMLGKSET